LLADDAPQPRRLLLVVAAALWDADGRVLIAQRPAGKSLAGLWEFPGGKVEAAESPEAALIRECWEEIGVRIEPRALQPLTFASHAYADFHLLMPLYAVHRWTGEPQPKEAQALAWAAPTELASYPMPPADLPLIPDLIAAAERRRAPL
jgi:8-oxo-dGTP diphosphatase